MNSHQRRTLRRKDRELGDLNDALTRYSEEPIVPAGPISGATPMDWAIIGFIVLAIIGMIVIAALGARGKA